MTVYQDSQSRLPLLLGFAARVRSVELQFRHNMREWVRHHIVDDDLYDTPEWRKLTHLSYR